MTIHVLIGADPVNLHHAIKIKKLDPDAQIILVDKRLDPETQSIDRNKEPATIIHFEHSIVQKLIDDEVNLDGITQGKDFSQIQTRDLQLAFLETLFTQGEKPLLIQEDIDTVSNESILAGINKLFMDKNITISQDEEVQIHVVYSHLAANQENQLPIANIDDRNMLYGSATFEVAEEMVHQEFNQQSPLANTEWQSELKEFGWKLDRAPRVQILYANGILQIIAEVPANIMYAKKTPNAPYETALSKEKIESRIATYTRKIAQLVFPDLAVKDLEVNSNLSTGFPNPPAEKISTATTKDGQSITLFNHGDAHYLQRDQIESNFVTGFLHNELYSEIYKCSTFEELLEFAVKKDPDNFQGRESTTIKDNYMKLTGANEEAALDAFRKELFFTFSRDIIEENKAKVDSSLKLLYSEALDLIKDLDAIIDLYNEHLKHDFKLTVDAFDEFDPKIVVIELLKTENINFIRALLPRLINKDLSKTVNDKLLLIRDRFIDDIGNLDKSKDAENSAEVREIIQKSTKETEESIEQRRVINSALNVLAHRMNVHLPIPSDLSSTENKLKLIFKHATTEYNVPFLSNLIDAENDELITHLQSIISKFKEDGEGKDLHHRHTFSFFKGKHSKTINSFIEDINVLIETYSDNPDLLKINALRKIIEFKNELVDGDSKRTLMTLKKAIQEISISPPKDVEINYKS